MANLLEYGIGQKVRDSASGAAKAAEAEGSKGVESEALAMMTACVESLYSGEWSTRGEGAGVDERTRVARSITRTAMKAALGKDSPEWKKFTGLSDADQLAKLDENFAANTELLSEAVDTELKRRADANKAKAKLAKSASFNI
jgi:hypothetical protein